MHNKGKFSKERKKKMTPRTDLAVECIGSDTLREGITRKKRGRAFEITEIIIDSDRHGSPIGKKKGRYITFEGASFGRFTDNFREMAEEFAEELSPFIPSGHILVTGIGNNDITPDALGPRVASKILATRHLRRELGSEDEFLSSLRPVSVTASGVLGQTGIETAEIVGGLLEKTKPSAVIAIDALACSELSRLGTTVQLSDSGISPGSGVQNKRRELSEATLGVPVVAVGVPTVVDMYTIIEEMTGKKAEEGVPNMMVTPRDVDRLIERSSAFIAMGINLALQPNMSFEDVESVMY